MAAASATVPSAPGTPWASGGDARATVSWSAPASDGGSPTTGYRVQPSIGTTAQAPVTFNSTAVTQVITGLTNSSTYTFKVSANVANDGQYGIGEADNVGTSVENLSGGAGNDELKAQISTLTANVFSGGLGADELYGYGGADSLSGDGGADSLFGGNENDTLRANDSFTDVTVDCGGQTSGTSGDLAYADSIDPKVSCERLG